MFHVLLHKQQPIICHFPPFLFMYADTITPEWPLCTIFLEIPTCYKEPKEKATYKSAEGIFFCAFRFLSPLLRLSVSFESYNKVYDGFENVETATDKEINGDFSFNLTVV